MKDVNFSISLVSALSRRMRFLSDKLHEETIYSSEAKIANVLIENSAFFKHFKNNEIASILNITPETLSRTLSKLKKHNIIDIKAHIVEIINPNALKNIIETNKMK